MSNRKYKVGYGRTPEHTRFKKGESGNLKGRPKNKKTKSMYVMLLEELEKRYSINTPEGEKSLTAKRLIAIKAVHGGMKGGREADLLLKLIRELEKLPFV